MIPGQLQVFLSPTNFEWYRMMSQSPPGCQDSFKMAASKVASFKMNFFRIEGTSEADASAECLLAIGEDKECKVFGTTLSFEGLSMLDHFDFQIGHSRVVICLCQNESLRKSIYEHEKVFHLQVSFSCK